MAKTDKEFQYFAYLIIPSHGARNVRLSRNPNWKQGQSVKLYTPCRFDLIKGEEEIKCVVTNIGKYKSFTRYVLERG